MLRRIRSLTIFTLALQVALFSQAISGNPLQRIQDLPLCEGGRTPESVPLGPPSQSAGSALCKAEPTFRMPGRSR